MSVLNQLVDELREGSIRVVDLTQPLGPDTPVIGLPDIFGQSPGLTVDVISRYDDAGPAWYWNTLTLGEHTGTKCQHLGELCPRCAGWDENHGLKTGGSGQAGQ